MKWIYMSAALLALITSGAQSAQYTFTDIGVLTSRKLVMNNQGQVAGMANGFAAIWEAGTLTSLDGYPTAEYGWVPTGLSENGQVAGYGHSNETDDRGNHYEHGLYWSSAMGVIDLGAPGGTLSKAYDVNDSGQVIGLTYGEGSDGSDVYLPFLWQNGIRTDLGTIRPTSINNRGQIVGIQDGHTVIWEDGISTEISYFVSPGLEINELGQVAGSIPTPTGLHAALWDSGVLTDLGTLGWKTSTFSGFNNRGQVVGSSGTLTQWDPGKPFLWQNGVMVDVNTLLSAGSEWQIMTADDINDSGQIVGKAYVNGVYHAYLLTPVPEPSSLVALGMGGLGVLGAALRRRRSR